jgi:hypothetical protein
MGGENQGEAKPLPYTYEYEHTPNPDWSEVIAQWEWKETIKDRWRVEGPCPRCTHKISEEVPVIPNAVFAEGESQPLVHVYCNCREEHPPEKKGKGCGMHARVPFPPGS